VADDLPPGIIGEKVVPDLKTDELLRWFADMGHDVKRTYSLRIATAKLKGKL
jgi:hypothetical protein